MNLTQSNQLQTELTDALCSKWWAAMGDIFGKNWYVQNGPEPAGVWKSSLSELKLERALAVLQHFRVSGDQFPPNLSQIMKVARELKLHAYDDVKKLERPRNQDVAARECRSMREILNRSRFRKETA